MKSQSWKDYAELIALVALVGTLIAVVVELRQTQAALQAQTYQDRAFDAIDFQFRAAANPVILNLVPASASLDPKELSTEEFESISRFWNAVRIDLDNEYYQYQRGFLEESFYLGSTQAEIKESAPIWRRFSVPEPREEFRREVDRILADESILPFSYVPNVAQ
jgi:hypothetical protein